MVAETRVRKGAKSNKQKDEKHAEQESTHGDQNNQTVNESGDASNANLTVKTKDGKNSKKKSKSKSSSGHDKQGWFGSCFDKAKYVLLLVFVPPFLNYASLQRESVELKPQGQLYDVGWGRKMFMSCHGQGPPTVLLDAPTGMNSDVWTAVVQKLSEHANVCVYDRAGLGFSERPLNQSRPQVDEDSQVNTNTAYQGAPFTAESMVDDVYKLISSSSQQPRPLILVGAELGAVVAQFYTHLYDTDVLGLVLVNPLPDDLFSDAGDAWVQHWFGSLGPTYQSLQLGAALGITRLGLLVGALKQPITGDRVPQDVILRQKYLLCHPRHLSSVVDEHHFINETFSQIKTLRKLRSLPTNISISVLSGNYYDEQMPSHLNKAWAIGEQKLLSKLPSSVQHFVVNGADRHMLYRKPDVIVDAVMKIIRGWKRKSKKM